MKTALTIVLTICIAFLHASADQQIVVGGLDGVNPYVDNPPPSILLALSGGGARGLSSIGVLKAFEEKGLNIAALAGTSMGGIVGGLYACGYSPDELNRRVSEIDFTNLFSNQPDRSTMFLTRREDSDKHLVTIRFDRFSPSIPYGLTTGQELTALFTSLTVKANYLAGGDFSQLEIPFLTVGTDIVAGDLVPLTGGSLADAMRATMAFPLAFTGVEDGDRLLMDGGMTAPVPVEQVRTLSDSIDFVVAVNTTSPLLPKEKLLSPIDIANQVTTIMAADQLHRQLSQADYIIEPDIAMYTSADFEYRDSVVARGYRAGLSAADSILSILALRADTRRLPIGEIHIEDPDPVTRETVRSALQGITVTRHELITHLQRLCRAHHLYQLTADPERRINEDSITVLDLTVYVSHCPDRNDLQVNFFGNSVFPDSTLSAYIVFPRPQVSPADIEAALDSVVALYSRNGFDLASVRGVAVSTESNRLDITIDEGIIQRIDIEGNERSRDWLVRSYFPLHRGEPYSTRKASEGIANIYGTALFDRVSIDLVPHHDGAIVKIRVVEKKNLQIRLGWHWVDEYQSEEFAEVLDDNVFGVGMEILGHARIGKDRWEYYGQMKADRVFSSYITARTRGYYTRTDRSLYDSEGAPFGEREEEKWGGVAEIGQQIARLGTVSGGIGIEEAKWYDKLEGTRRQISLRSIYLESQVETLDQLRFPTGGNRYRIALQLTGKLVGGDVEFTRYISSFESYWRFTDWLNYHPHLTIGISRTGLPPTEKFYAGGIHSFSGYQTDELSGDKIFLLNHELRAALPYRMYLYGRFDVGEVYTSTDQIKLENLRIGYGVSLAVDFPLGPLEFGYGITRDNNDQFYFNAGLNF